MLDVVSRARGPARVAARAGRGTRGADNGRVEPWEMREWHAEYLDACNRHDLDAIRSFIDPSVRRAHLPGGADAFIADMADLFHAFPDWRWRRIQLIAEDDRLAVHLRGGGTHLGAFRGIPATRRHVNVAEFAMYRVQKGRIAEATGTDTGELLAQIGG
ncbi:Predicted ester cyclase (modular protein) [uncultured Microbacterium sp.]|uniref:Predicted ester cyclase (Modular protein) n=1 Tax=uncultured Microbacterium sp. TaxID=191216 RepID=A0A1Y5P4I2_9MICO|nr:Predicted ester cyclase (modular protein) [uncultured Microbacterium sp.]